jgi:hypothetical protein
MPLIDDRPVVGNLTNIAGSPDEEINPSIGEVAGAALRSQNIVGSWWASRGMPDPFQIEDGFDGVQYFIDQGMDQYVEQGAGVFNRKAADARILQIKREEQDRRTLDAAGGLGTLAEMAAGTFDLPTLLPIGGGLVGAGRGLLGTAVRAGIGAGIDAGVSEAALQATQATRTPGESVANVGGSIILGGALGTLAGRYLGGTEAHALSRKIEEQPEAFDRVDNLTFGGGAQSAGAAAKDTGPLELKDEALIKKLWGVRSQDPLIRSQLSDFNTARRVSRQLAETPLEYKANAQGVATEIGGSVETRMKMWQAPLADSLQQIDTAYARYFHDAQDPNGWQVRLAPMRSEMQRITGGDKLTYKQFKEEVGKAAFSGDKHSIPAVEQAAQIYRRLDDAMKQAAIKARLLPEDVQLEGDISHLFRMYNKDKIAANRSDFGRILNDYFISKRDAAAKVADAEATAKKAGKEARQANAKLEEFSRMSDQEVRELVEDTIDTILGNADGRIPYDAIVSGPRGPLKERLLRIESRKIQDFLNTDIEEVMHSQVRTMSADVELAKKFGSPDMAEQIRQINDEANRKIAAVDGMTGKGGKPATEEAKAKERTRLDRARKAAVRDIKGMRDRIRGQYALPSNPNGIALRAGRVVRNLNYLRLLGGMTLSAFGDLGGIVLKHGLTSTFKDGFVPLITNLRAVRLAGDEVKAAGTALDMVLDSRAMSIADITDDFGRGSRFERGVRSLSTRFGVVSLMAPWNAAVKQWSGMVVMTNILRTAEKVAAGKATQSEIRKLAAAGIDADLAQRITKEYASHGDRQGSVLLAKAGDWQDRGAKEAFRTAVVRDVDRIVVTPGQDKPLWMSTELGKTVGQFRSFQISAMQRVALAGLQQRDAATLSGIMVSLGLGALAYWSKQVAAGKDVSDNPAVWAANAIDQSGLTGWFMEANNMAEKATRGRVGLSALTGEQISRFATRNVTGAFLGPTPGAISDIFQVSGSIFAGDTTKADLNKVRQMIPGQNIFYIRRLFNLVEDATGDALGLPETRKQ